MSIRVLPLALTASKVSQSILLATGSMPVVGSSRKITGGSPIKAIPVLSFRLFPPLQPIKRYWWIVNIRKLKRKKDPHQFHAISVYVPQLPCFLVRMVLQQKGWDTFLNNFFYEIFFDSSKTSVHCKGFFDSHLLNKSIKLRTVAKSSLNLSK